MMPSAISSGTSTREKRSVIWMAPMARGSTPASFTMAPTRSAGRIFGLASRADVQARDVPLGSDALALPLRSACCRAVAGALAVGGRLSDRGPGAADGRAGARRPGISSSSAVALLASACFTAAAATSMTSNSCGQRLDDARGTDRARRRGSSRAATRASARAGARAGRPRSAPARSRSSACVWCSMLRSSRCSRGSASVIATPSRPARPVRPMRCTYASGGARARRSSRRARGARRRARARRRRWRSSRSAVLARNFFITRSRCSCDSPPCSASAR